MKDHTTTRALMNYIQQLRIMKELIPEQMTEERTVAEFRKDIEHLDCCLTGTAYPPIRVVMTERTIALFLPRLLLDAIRSAQPKTVPSILGEVMTTEWGSDFLVVADFKGIHIHTEPSHEQTDLTYYRVVVRELVSSYSKGYVKTLIQILIDRISTCLPTYSMVIL